VRGESFSESTLAHGHTRHIARRINVTLTIFAIGGLGLLAFAPLSQAKVLVNGFGTPTMNPPPFVNPPPFGGQMAVVPGFSTTSPRGVAVNVSGNGAPVGTAYVVDGNGHRVQRFGPLGDWQRLWGQDVIAASVNERQRLTIDAAEGKFTLTFGGDTTSPIAFDGSSSSAFTETREAIDNALDTLPSIGSDANVVVSADAGDGPIFFITFTGALAAADQPQLSVDASQLIGTAEVDTLADGTASTTDTGTGFEICTVRIHCQRGANTPATANGGQLNTPQGIAVNQSNGHVYVTENGNSRVSEFDAAGNFIRAWGWDVIDSGPGSSEFGAADLSSAIGVAAYGSSGEAYVSDQSDNLIHVFGPAPSRTQTSSFDGSDTSAGAFAALGRIAVHQSSGTIYAIDNRGSGGVVDKFDASGAAQSFSALGSSSLDGAAVSAPDGPVTFDLGEESDIAVDNSATASNGRLYVLTEYGPTAATAFAFDSAGNYLHKISPPGADTCGIAVDSGGDVWIADYESFSVIEYDAAGNPTGASVDTSAQGNPCHISFDASDNLYVALYQGALYKYSSAGVFLSEVDTALTSSVAVDPSTGHVFAAHSDKISEYDPAAGPGFEICELAAECQQGAQGANGGQFGASLGHPITDASNAVWVPDASNRRIQKFGPNGAFLAAYGYDVDALGGSGGLEECASTAVDACQGGAEGAALGQFSSANPTQIAFDSSGNLYALDPGNSRVQKFNPTFTDASTFGSSLFFTSTPVPGGSPVTDNVPERLTSLQGGNRLAFALNRVVGFTDHDQNPATPDQAVFERQIDELDPTDESLEDRSLVGAGIRLALGGLRSDEGDRLYATVPFGFAQGQRCCGPRQVLVLADTPPPPPVASLQSVSVKTDTTATFEGTVDPLGGIVTCKFQYSTDQVLWKDVPDPGCDELANGGGPQAIEQGAFGLKPNTHYFLRLQVSRPLVPSSTVTTPVQSFDTDSVPPVVTDVGAIQVADTSARLVGTIDPRNAETTYVFEYGTTLDLDNETIPLSVGSGTTPLTVSQVVGDLSPDTTYFFRMVATNPFGSTASATKSFHTRTAPFPPRDPGNCGNQARRAEQGSTFLPDCRAFEMVSPPEKNQGSVARNVQIKAGFSRDGNGVAFCTSSLFGEPPPQITNFCGAYVSRRSGEGWQTSSPFPPFCAIDYDSPEGATKKQNVYLSPQSFERAVVGVPEHASCAIEPIDPAAPLGSVNLYRQDLNSDPPQLELLTPAPPDGLQVEAGLWAGGSDDFSHVVYASTRQQTADAPDAPGVYKVYDWEEEGHGDCVTSGGCLSLVSVDPGGAPLTTHSKLPGFGIGGSATSLTSGVSADGERIYFLSEATSETFGNGSCETAGCEIYLREDGITTPPTTLHVSASECTLGALVCFPGPDHLEDESPARFVWSNPDGDKALFLSCAKLTDASGEPKENGCEIVVSPDTSQQLKLYRWDREADPGERLVDLTADNEPADGSQPRAVDLIGASDDGNVVYFVAGGQIVAGAPTGTGPAGKISGTSLKLFRWRWNGGIPAVDYLAPYLSTRANGTSENSTHVQDDPNANRKHVRVTPDGKYLAIQTKLALDVAADRDADADLYRWDEVGGWLCVSCQLPGVPSSGHVSSVESGLPHNNLESELVSREPEHTISDDGQRIFFSTPDALVSEDVNGEDKDGDGKLDCPITSVLAGVAYSCQDVYEWHDGTISLITPGIGTNPFILIGGSGSGNDVFFGTRERLVGWDVDNAIDIYTAHVGGGFKEPPPAPPTCEAEGCRDAGTSAPDVPGAGTAVFQGPDNASDRCKRLAQGSRRKLAAARKAEGKRAQRLRRQATNLKRRARRCNRRAAR
jgi:NHL repeat